MSTQAPSVELGERTQLLSNPGKPAEKGRGHRRTQEVFCSFIYPLGNSVNRSRAVRLGRLGFSPDTALLEAMMVD